MRYWFQDLKISPIEVAHVMPGASTEAAQGCSSIFNFAAIQATEKEIKGEARKTLVLAIQEKVFVFKLSSTGHFNLVGVLFSLV